MTFEGGDRRSRLLRQLHSSGGPVAGTDHLIALCASATGVTGAGLMLMSGDVSLGSVAATDAVSALIEDQQFALGEGPCIDAYRLDRPVLEPDLANPRVPRWVAFTPAVLAAGAGAVFGFPLQVGAARLGALNLYNDRAGELQPQQHADALIMAAIAAESLLLMQAGAKSGELAAELETGANLHAVVHQATGMVSAQLGIYTTQALIRLRGHAFGHGRPLVDIASDIVERRLRFPTPDP
ncbi:MAG: ANTAR domain-containing protein [Acidimicrobiia bacterium]